MVIRYKQVIRNQYALINELQKDSISIVNPIHKDE